MSKGEAPVPWHPHITVATLIERDSRFLMVEERIAGRRVLNQPAGHVEAEERILSAAHRETREESGWEIKLDAFLGIYVLRIPETAAVYHRYAFIARALRHHDEPLDTDILATHWMTADHIRQADSEGRLRSPMVLKCLEDYLSGQRFPLNLIFEP